jgi:RHH-type transcriptional regulator, rel operon repressor / antitoxin RelB
MSSTMTIRPDDDVKDRLARLADSTQRCKSYLAAEAFRDHGEANEWQLAEIEAALREADAGLFATDAEVIAFARKWGVGTG